MSTQRPILIMAGGTGGHVFPALAVAEALRERGCALAWLGARSGLEARVVPDSGIPMHWIKVQGLRGKGVLRWFAAPFMLLGALVQALWIVLRLRPAAVLGMGGFTTGPGGVAAWLLRCPLLIHEQNAIAGVTNRILARIADPVLEAFPGSLSGARHTGNPVRGEIADMSFEEPRLEGRRARLLVVGGSLGAAVFNEQVPRALALLELDQRPEVLHQTGIRHIDVARSNYTTAGVEAHTEAFIDDMAAAYRWADLVLCRAGAMTVAELAAVGVASILVPYPYAVDDHQTANAAYLVSAGAALLLPQAQLNAERLAEHLQLLQEPQRLTEMARRARARALPDAADRVAEACIQAAGRECAA